MTSIELEPLDPITALTEKPWINQINAEQLKLLQATVCKGLSGAEVGHFLEIARGLGMNPWANEIWAAKSQGRDGGEGKLLLMVGRDGLIAHAERKFDDYAGYDAGVIYENDTFERIAPDPAGKTLRERAGVVHGQGHPSQRGAVVGAWAACERRGRPPRYFDVSLDEYMPKSEKKVQYSPWGSAVAVMIEKVPISIVHRTLCGLGSQVYLEEELARRFDAEGSVVLGEGAIEDRGALLDAIIDNIPLEQQERAKELIDEQNSLAPHSWSASKVELVFRGKRKYETSRELAAIEKTIEELRARPPLQVGDAVEDAEVVDEAVDPGETRSFGWECPHCHRGLLGESEACSGKLTERDHPLNVGAVPVVVPATADELAVAERVHAARVADLEEALAGDDLSEQQRSDAEAELDALTTAPPSEDVDGQAALEL